MKQESSALLKSELINQFLIGFFCFSRIRLHLFLISFLFMVFLTKSYSQSPLFTWFEKSYINSYKTFTTKDFDFHGKVKSVTQLGDMDDYPSMTTEFNKMGQLLTVSTSDDSFTLTTEYNKKECLVSVQTKGDSRNNEFRSKNSFIMNEFDKKNKLKKTVFGDDGYSDLYSKTYKYDKRGNVMQIIHESYIEEYDSIVEKFYYHKNQLDSISRSYFITYKYDSSKNLNPLQNDHTEVFEYHKNGKIKKSKIMFKKEMDQLQITKSFSLDGKIITHYKGDSLKNPYAFIVKKYQYNDRNFLMEKLEKGIYDGAYQRLLNFEYEYDSEGNWITEKSHLEIKSCNPNDQTKIDESIPPVNYRYTKKREFVYY